MVTQTLNYAVLVAMDAMRDVLVRSLITWPIFSKLGLQSPYQRLYIGEGLKVLW